MKTTPTNMWGIHAGVNDEASTLFLDKNVIAIGWAAAGDLDSLPNDIMAFRQLLSSAYPDMKARAISVNAGQLYRFVYVMQPEDIVVYPSPSIRMVNLGRIAGDYTYNKDNGYPNQRAVQWLKQIPRDNFSQGARFEIGSAMTLFRVQNYAFEFLNVLQGIVPVPAPAVSVSQEDAINEVPPPNIEEVTQDFILTQLSQSLKGHPLAAFVAHLFSVMGYKTYVSPPGADGGTDIILYKDEFRLTPPIIRVQVKSTSGTIGNQEVGYLNGVLKPDEYGLFVTLGEFTKAALQYEREHPRTRLINGAKLSELILQHYDALDPKYKSIIPLKKIYAPDTTEFQSN